MGTSPFPPTNAAAGLEVTTATIASASAGAGAADAGAPSGHGNAPELDNEPAPAPAPACNFEADTADSGIGSVVDDRLRVHGVQGLRIADASVFPCIPTAPTAATCMAVGAAAAEFVLFDCNTAAAAVGTVKRNEKKVVSSSILCEARQVG